MGKQEFTISLFSEDHIGILNQITIILTRRQINIESITASESAVKGVQSTYTRCKDNSRNGEKGCKTNGKAGRCTEGLCSYF